MGGAFPPPQKLSGTADDQAAEGFDLRCCCCMQHEVVDRPSDADRGIQGRVRSQAGFKTVQIKQ